MKIAKQGHTFIQIGLGVGVVGWLLGRFGAGLCPLGFGFAVFCAYFFRDPDRPPPPEDRMIYSPGDGKVLSVAQEGGADGPVTMRIFLSIFDVHLQRNPCSGTVTRVVHRPGTFAMAMAKEAMQNERVVMTIDPGQGRAPLVVEQIAGYVARRIECWAKEGDAVRVGEKYGIIYFGSQAAVHFPKGSRPTAVPGDKVAGGVTVIGEWTG